MLGAIMTVNARTLNVTGVERVNTPTDMLVTEAVISPDGKFVVVNDAAGTALHRVEVVDGSAVKVTDNGSILDLKISGDGNQIVYRQRTQNKKRLSQTSLCSTDLTTGKTVEIVKPTREFNGFAMNADDVVSATSGRPGNAKARTKALGATKSNGVTSAGIYRGHLTVTVDGKTSILDPQGHGSYLWPSISPDGKHILYYKSQSGCYVCNLDGSEAKNLGYIQAAKWMDNETVVGMQPVDDGTNIISSAVVAADMDGNIQRLTSDDVIAMYPSASTDGSKVAFTDTTGNVYIINIATE